MPRLALFAHRLSTGGRTGTARYTAELAAEFDRLDNLPADYVLTSAPERARLEWRPARLAVRRVPFPRRPLHLVWTGTRRPRIEHLIGRVDAVHALEPSTVVPTAKPFAYTIHDMTPMQYPDWYAAGPRWAFDRSLRYARDAATMVICDSAATAADVHDLAGIERERLHVVPLGISDDFRRPIAAGQRDEVCARYSVAPGRYFLHVGLVTARKNLLTVVRALASLEGATLVLAGPDGFGADRIHAEIESLGLAGAVRTPGFIPDADLPALMAGATALVHPSQHEGFGFTPLEAMAVGTPAIASDAGSLPEMLGDAAVLVKPEDRDAWAAAMALVRDDPDHRSALVAKGRARSARFTWQRTAQDVLALHRLLLAS